MFPPIPFSFSLNPIATILRSLFFYAPRTSTITQTRGAGTPTETRATVATVMGYAADAVLADGQTLLTVASGELRHEGARRISEGVWSTVDADGAPIPAATLKGAVVEAEATNLCLQSQNHQVTWAAVGTPTITPANVVCGALSLDLIGDDSAAALEGYTQTVSLVSDGVKSVSVYMKAGTSAVTQFRILDVTAGVNRVNCAVTWTAGVPSTAFFAGSEERAPELLTNGIYRFRVLTTAVTAANTNSLQIYPATNGLGVGEVGNVNVGGWQVESNPYATSYIPTTTVAVTRNADVLDDQVSSNLTAAAGTVAFTWTPSHDPSGTIALCGSYVDASNYTALLHDATKYIWRKRIAGVNYDAELTAAYANGTSAKISLTWGASGINLAVDGTLGTAHANTDDAQLGTRWQWGADGNGGQQAGAAFKEMYLTPRTMSDAELQAITI